MRFQITMELPTNRSLFVWNASDTGEADATPFSCGHDLQHVHTTCLYPYNVTGSNTISAPFYPWDNPHSLISRDTLIALEKAVTCGLNPLLLAVGLPSNVLNCLVFQRQGLGDRMNVSLFSLALVDLFCVVFWFLLGSFCLVGHALPFTPYIMGWFYYRNVFNEDK